MLKLIEVNGVGPVPKLRAEWADRLNILTGDNGLGKSFLLDLAWWAMTGSWAGGKVALPDSKVKKPTITYQVSGKSKTPDAKIATFDFPSQSWIRQMGRPTIPGLVIYGRVDGSFSVWDPARNYWRDTSTGAVEALDRPQSYEFNPDTLWNGLRDTEGRRTLCNGLIQDWVYWQNQAPKAVEVKPFELLRSVIQRLSHPQEPMEPGEPVRLFIDDSRMFPTIKMPYGVVPLTQAAAGVKRVLGLAYLVVWAWDEHIQACRLRQEKPTDRLILILDEVESHLHPKWQRTILPSLLEVVNQLNAEMRVQVICSTHSPLVMASLEPIFDEARDCLFWFDLEESVVHFRAMPWTNYGDVVGWLTSPIFDLKQARSREAEDAVEAAKAFLRGDKDALPPGLKTRPQIDKRLKELLGGQDPFLVRWHVSTLEAKA